MVGRPRLYELPEFERFLVDGARTNHRMARVYTQQVCKLLALIPKDPAEADVRAALVQVQTGRGRDTKAAWNAYAEMQGKAGVRLPTIAKTPRMIKLDEVQRALTQDMQLLADITGASLRELVDLKAPALQFFKTAQGAAEWEVAVTLPTPPRVVFFALSGEHQLMRRLWSAYSIAYASSTREVSVFDGGRTWDDWCVLAASAGLRFESAQISIGRLGVSPAVAPPMVRRLAAPTLREVHWDSCLRTWLNNPDMSWNELQQMIWDVPESEATTQT